MTNSTQSNDATAVLNMSHCKGSTPVSAFNRVLAYCAKAAPPPTINELPSPDAVPARCGRTDSKPAVTLGRAIPFPSQRKLQNPKKISGCWMPTSPSASDVPSPAMMMAVPTIAILLIPNLTEYRPERKLPIA